MQYRPLGCTGWNVSTISFGAWAIGVHLVDAPLSRTPREAWVGTLDTMVGADAEIFQRIEPLLQTFMEYTLRGNTEARKFTLTNAYKSQRYLESMADDAGVAILLGNAVKNSFGLPVQQGGPEKMVPMLPELVAGLSGVVLKANDGS